MSCASFINCASRISNRQVDDILDTDIATPLYNLTE